jgi:hypothetical protein
MTTKKTAGLTLALLALIALALAAPAGAGPAYGSPTLDGVRDAIYGAPIGVDPSGDLANPGPGGWSRHGLDRSDRALLPKRR